MSSMAKAGVRMFEGTCIIQPRYELQIFYEMDKKFHLLFTYKANLTSLSNVYLDNAGSNTLSITPSHAGGGGGGGGSGGGGSHSSLTVDAWHGKCSIGLEGRVFDANLSLDLANCKYGRASCSFMIHCSVAWDMSVQMQHGWKNGQPLPENQLIVEEIKSTRTNVATQYRITFTLPQSMMPAGGAGGETPMITIDTASASTPFGADRSRLKPSSSSLLLPPPAHVHRVSVIDGVDNVFALSLSELTAKIALEDAEKAAVQRKLDNKIAYTPAEARALEALNQINIPQFVLVVNARNIKQGGPMRYCMSYYFDLSKQQGQNIALIDE
jgi:hypothetical protein